MSGFSSIGVSQAVRKYIKRKAAEKDCTQNEVIEEALEKGIGGFEEFKEKQ